MDKINLKRNILIFASTFALYSSIVYCSRYEPNYEILGEDEEAYGRYEDGLIYIGDREYIRSLLGNVQEGDVLVIDKRSSIDPDMQIIDSYKITDKDNIKDILNCLLEYESETPSCWDRFLVSMIAEWDAHNVLYTINFKRNRTQSVDLNNADEIIYSSIFMKKLFYRK